MASELGCKLLMASPKKTETTAPNIGFEARLWVFDILRFAQRFDEITASLRVQGMAALSSPCAKGGCRSCSATS